MNHAVVEKNLRKPRILVAPLDWGLGHATRCIPIIKELYDQGCEPILAVEGAQGLLLKEEFPGILTLPLKGYRVRYASTAPGLIRQMIVQSPRLINTIKAEHKWLESKIREYQIEGVISDNRYGLSSKKIPTVFITHQLGIKTPLGRWSENLLQRINYRYINRFSECWVPDNSDSHNLSGALSHPLKLPEVPTFYLGPISRFEKATGSPQKDHLLIILSGPEPQRTILENKIIGAIAHYHHSACIVRGLPGNSKLIPSTNMIRFYNHLPAKDLQAEFERAEYVISRSGYSTVMDIAALQKKSILIPTPGQTEQEYLAEYLMKKNFAFTISQSEFDLSKALAVARLFNYKLPATHASGLKKNISRLIQNVKYKT